MKGAVLRYGAPYGADMEEDLEHFLRSREVPHDDIMHMQQDKVRINNKALNTVVQKASNLNPIALDDTVGKLYEQTKLKLLRFYICTKDETLLTVQSSSEEDFSVSITEEDSPVTLLGFDSETDDFVPDLLEHGDSSDSDTGKQVC
uniref:Uncharacterized protein n=1 Tax=Maylandia zebra TaxID=106582 RepID=A0A3P9BK40_9CICH